MRKTPREKLEDLLRDEGFDVGLWIPVTGQWRKEDVMRWEAHAFKAGAFGTQLLGSWDTMTECARNGITVEKEDAAGMHWLVWAKSPKRHTAAKPKRR